MSTARLPRRIPPHGTLHRRKTYRCDCEPCIKRERDYTNNRTRLQAYGRWQPYVDAEPVRQHVRSLMAAGIGIQTIGRLAGVPSGTMTKLLYGERRRGLRPSQRVRPETASRLLAIQPSLDLVADSARIPAIGTQRRIQALMAAGWPQRRIADEAGIDYHVVNLALRRDILEGLTARAIRDAYNRIWNVNPVERGVQRRFADQAKRTAAANGWPLPAAWDEDIDDPAAEPNSGGPVPRYIALAEDAAWLERQGYTREHAAARLGVSHSYLNTCISRWQRSLQEAA